VDWKDIDRIRVPGFTLGRRGYDKHEVDRFLARLADWLETDAPNEIGEMAVTRKLELVGKSTSHILMTTEQQATELRKSSEEECAQMISEAEAAAQQTREAADQYAKQTRAAADQYAKQTRAAADQYGKQTHAAADADAQKAAEAAGAQARATIEEGEHRRAQVESVIADLEVRRDDALADLDALRKELGAAISSHRPAARNGRNEERATRQKEPAAKA
jgi:DivIVA domain-containing protein